MKKLLVLAAITMITISFAQPQGGPNPETRALIEPYTNLTTSVSLILELEKMSDLPVTAEQASLLLPILVELDTSPGYDGERAVELLDTMELEILSIDQLTWMDGEFIRRREAAQNGEGRGGLFGGRPAQGENGQAGQGQGQRGQGQGGQGQGGQGQGGQGQQGQGGRGGAGGIFQRVIAGEPVNMFTDNPNASESLKELIMLVEAKLE